MKEYNFLSGVINFMPLFYFTNTIKKLYYNIP